MATERYRNNFIAMLKLPDGTEVENHTGNEGILLNVFKERLGESSPPNQKFDPGSIITKIDGLEELYVPFTEAEIDEVVGVRKYATCITRRPKPPYI